MDFEFLSPIEDKLLAHNLMLPEQVLGRNLRIHTKQEGFPDLNETKIAIVTLEPRLSKGDSIHFRFRQQFYKLFSGNWDFVCADLGILKAGESPEDTLFALQTLVKEMHQRNILTIIVGGEQENTLGLFRGLSKMNMFVNLTSIDSRLDFGAPGVLVSDESYMSKIITEKPNNLKQFTNLGFQSYFVSQEELDLMQKLFFDAYRLGEITSDIHESEPILRDTDILSVDFNAIKANELDYKNGNPNGFDGAQICSLMRYAGLSDRLSVLGLFDLPSTSRTDQLLAQMVWYVLEGYCHRVNEYPFSIHEPCKKFVVPQEQEMLTFFRSEKSQRWWIEVPKEGTHNNTKETTLLPCAEKDYRIAQKGDIPARWWKSIQRSMH
ncbi:MAG: arginase [Bacteroidetes bacterium]|nr:arginase [Bacteroidota bacterium]